MISKSLSHGSSPYGLYLHSSSVVQYLTCDGFASPVASEARLYTGSCRVRIWIHQINMPTHMACKENCWYNHGEHNKKERKELSTDTLGYGEAKLLANTQVMPSASMMTIVFSVTAHHKQHLYMYAVRCHSEKQHQHQQKCRQTQETTFIHQKNVQSKFMDSFPHPDDNPNPVP